MKPKLTIAPSPYYHLTPGTTSSARSIRRSILRAEFKASGLKFAPAYDEKLGRFVRERRGILPMAEARPLKERWGAWRKIRGELYYGIVHQFTNGTCVWCEVEQTGN